MKIVIPEWLKKSGKYVLTGVGAVVGLLWVQSGQDPKELEKYTQIFMTSDSVMTVVNGDTIKHKITDNDLLQVFRAKDLYCDGYTQHVWEYKTVNLITGDVTPQHIVSSIPAIGTQVNWKIRHGKAEMAAEKIPEKLETLPVEKAAEIGWYPVVDTIIKGEVKTDVKVWTTDKDRKPKTTELINEEIIP